MMAVHTSNVDPLPHQITAVLGEHVSLAELARFPAVLLEPVQAEFRVAVEVNLGQEARANEG